MSGPSRRPRRRTFFWQHLSVRGKLALAFGTQLTLLGILSIISIVSLASVQQQRELLRQAQQLEILAARMEVSFQRASELQSDMLLGWGDVGYEQAAEIYSPAHAAQMEQVATTAGSIETLLLGTSYPSAARVMNNARTLESVGEFYEERFGETITSLGRLADEEDGAFVVLDRQGRELEINGLNTFDGAAIATIALVRREEAVFRVTGNPTSLDRLRIAAFSLNGRLNFMVAQNPNDRDAVATQDALNVYLEQVDVVEQLNDDFNAKADSLDALLGEAQPILLDLQEQGSIEAAQAFLRTERISRTTSLALTAGIIVSVVLSAVVTIVLARDFNTKITHLTTVARYLQAGDRRARVEVDSDDEFGQLAITFNAMADRLEGLVESLESRAVDRARDLEAIAEISRSITQLQSPEALLDEVVELILNRFDFYHAQVFLLDDVRQFAVLRASSGDAGAQLLARHHRLQVGSQSVIGQVTARNRAVVALDTDVDAVHRRNELLPDTRSEMALPMRVGNEVVGALDVQSVAANAFDDDDVAAFQIMADQLAVAVYNATLYQETQTALAEVESLNRRLTGLSWEQFVSRRDPDAPRAYRIEGSDIESDEKGISETLLERLGGEPVVLMDGEENGDVSVAVPIRVRGEVIGALGFGGGGLAAPNDEELALIEAVAERVGLALENIRLFEQTQQQARREQLVNQITSKIVGSSNVDDILQTTVRELGKVLRSPRTSVKLLGDSADE